MPRRGWATARDAADTWQLVSVYDDGWIVAPVAVPTAEDTRRRVRALIGWMVLVVGLFVASAAAAVWAGSLPWLTWVLLAASLGALTVAAARAARRRSRQRPPVYGSAAEHRAAADDVTRVALDAVRTVTLQRQGHEDVVTVTLRKGRPLVYRSPDRTLGRLFDRWSPAPPAG
ncbi:hypothetical protein [Modestobacter versicolor]|uniref:hypothetical protein n=1 Tax=Modestobacter versicolor TaxID=429133 RepID=UPI0034DF1F46